MKPLRLVDSEEPTRAEIAMAEIDQEHREAKWTPFSEPQKNPTFNPDEVLDRAARYAMTEKPAPAWRKLVRWMKGIR